MHLQLRSQADAYEIQIQKDGVPFSCKVKLNTEEPPLTFYIEYLEKSAKADVIFCGSTSEMAPEPSNCDWLHFTPSSFIVRDMEGQDFLSNAFP